MKTGVAVALSALACAGCGGEDRRVTVYVEQRLGSAGPPGQLAPVLSPVDRGRRAGLGEATQALVQLRQGPTPAERARGMGAPLPSGTTVRLERIERGTAYVAVRGEPLDLIGVASVVYSLTEIGGVERVRVCCAQRQDGTRVFVHTRRSFRGWSGEPCGVRRQHRCLGEP